MASKPGFSTYKFGSHGLKRVLDKLQGHFDNGDKTVDVSDWVNSHPDLFPPHLSNNDSFDEALWTWAERHPGAIKVSREWHGASETFQVEPLTKDPIQSMKRRRATREYPAVFRRKGTGRVFGPPSSLSPSSSLIPKDAE